ncbi:hypothetical protein SLEP1_g32565 [Rubroshorea leprosula]|uniref:Uncharacterized protein n=1 Tax=Rubroshorea leprosula TaxID=152421 RepID=A0AAV5KDV4_9ROSI|nr:hypothetical protein SLEP1_g32565 [Rubroshorea leprosula]
MSGPATNFSTGTAPACTRTRRHGTIRGPAQSARSELALIKSQVQQN